MGDMVNSHCQWIGNIPRDWQFKPIKRLLLSRDGGAWGNEAPEDGGTICMRIADFDYDKGVFKDTPVDDLTKRQYSTVQVGKLKLAKGDILIEKSGGGEKTPVGRTVIFDKDYDALFANFMDRLRFDYNTVLPYFAEYWLRAWYGCKSSPFYINQTIGIQNIDLTLMLSKECMYYPDNSEQQAIVAFLDSKCAEIDALSADIQFEIETLEAYKRSVITEAVTKGLDKNAPMKDSGIEWVGEIPDTWRSMPIGALFEEVTLKNSQGIVKNALKFTYGSIVPKDNFEADDDQYVASTILNYTIVTPGTIMINGLNLNFDFVTQRVGLVKDRGIITSAYMAIRPIDERFSSKYAMYVFKSYDSCKAFHNMGGGVRKILNFNEFKRYYVPCPSRNEQDAIVAYLDDKCAEIDAIIAQKQEQISVLSDYKKSLIYEYVTGKKEVPMA